MDALCWFNFLARPLPTSPQFCDFGGAYINAWVAHRDDALAEQIARDAIAQANWQVEQIEEQSIVSRESYATAPESLPYFEQAVVDGYCLVFHTWPSDAEHSN